MRILVTGAAGFLGSHLCDYLILNNHIVIGMDNFITGTPENLSHLSGNKDFTFILHDVSKYIHIDKKLDAVLHLASPASPNPESPFGYPNLRIQTMKAGALGTHNCLGVCRSHNARFLLASTSEIYGDPIEHPQRESYWGHVNPIGPRSMYDEAKRFAEALTMSYFYEHELDTRIVRIFNTYGPRMRSDDGRAIPNFIQQALKGHALTLYGDGQQTRSFCYVDDLIEGIYRLLMSEEHMPMNIGNPNEVSIEYIANTINDLAKNRAGCRYLPSKRLGDDPQRRCPDISYAKSALGWEPKIDLVTGLNKTLEYFQKEIQKQ